MDENDFKIPDSDIQIPEEELPEFTLEDILREFGTQEDGETLRDASAPDVMADIPRRELLEDLPPRDNMADLPLAESAPRGEEPDLLVWTPGQKKAPAPQEPAGSDTIRIDTAQVKAQAPSASVTDDTQPFTPLGEQPAAMPEPFRVNPIPADAEPFSANWEPQYDQPIGEYTPPEPIIFRPRSRLGELKRKLMEGPEQRYYALCEKGVGKLQIALFVSMLIVVLAVASIVLHRLDMVRENRMRLLVFGELFAMLISALLCWERLADGIGNLFRARFNADTLLVFSFAACIADGIYCLQQVKIPFCAAFCLQGLMCLWSEYQKRSTELLQMDTLRKATRLHRVTKVPNCHEERPGFRVTEGQPEDFMDTYSRPTAPGKALDRFTLLALILSASVAIAAGLRGGVQTGVRTWSAAILAACPATLLICQTRPMWTLQRRLHRFGSVLCGWQGVRAAAGKAVVPLSDEDLLPVGSVKINGVKFYSNRNPDTIIGYAAAVMNASGSCLAPLFDHMCKSRRAQTYEPEEFRSYGDNGWGAVICGERVLMGTQDFLRDKGVEMPAGTRVNQAVYVSIDDEFVCVIALAFGKLKGVSAGLHALCAQRRLTPVLATSNFLLNESFLRSKYGVDTRRISIPPVADREKLAAWSPEIGDAVPSALTTQEGLAGAAFAITGARSLRIASIAGAVVHILGGTLGLAAVLFLTVRGRTDLMTPANLLLLELCWAIPGLMISEWTRNS